MRKKDDIRRRLWLRRLFKIHTWLLVISFGLYFTFAFLDPGLFSYDLRQRFHAFADDTIIITATVLGPPEQPVVIATPECDENTRVLSVELDWADDPNTYTFDVDRDGLPLVSGLTASEYSDTNVALSTSYEYVVTAYGPMGSGSATSLPVNVTTPDECEITQEDVSVNIVSFNGKNVANTTDGGDSTSRTPFFTGVTNIPNAIIELAIQGESIYVASMYANVNGYWEWRPPTNLSYGAHSIIVTATDPNDSSRVSSDTLTFRIVKKSGNTENPSKKKDRQPPSAGDAQKLLQTISFLDFSLILKNKDNIVLQGEDLIAVLKIQGVDSGHNDVAVPVRYSILDTEKKVVFSEIRETFVRAGRTIEESITIPLYTNPQDYSLAVEFLFDDMTISRVADFQVVALPLFKLSDGAAFTYADFIRNLGWIALLFLIIFLVWLFLFLREFALYLHGQGHVTEQQLKKAGFFHK